MKLLKDTNSAEFALRGVQTGAKVAGQTATTATQKKGLLGRAFDVMNAISVPAMIAPLFLPNADTRAQEKMLNEIKKNPHLGIPFKLPGLNVNDPETPPGKITVANPNPKLIQPGQLPPRSLA